MRYGQLTEALVARLIAICGASNVIYGDADRLEPYSHDEVADERYQHHPDAVVKPRTTAEVAAIMQLANEHLIPVTPRGAGSGLSGGAVPLYGGIVLSLERMNAVLEIDPDNLMVIVEPGVVTNDINDAVKEHGLFYAGYPMSLETCYIGGNVAENAGGGKAIKYGVTSRYVYGLECVLPTGDVVRFGGKRVKDVTGYDLIHLLVGSEGTLAIFTEITLKLLPLPKASVDLLVLFPDPASAIKMVPQIMTESGIIPTAVEFMDRLSAQTSCDYLNEHFAYQEAGAMLLLTVDGYDVEQIAADYETIGELCLGNGAIEVYVADNPTTSERVWRVRRNIAEAFKVYSPVQSIEDIVVPFADIPKLMSELERISARHDVVIPCYGHAGDGNLHATIVKKPEMALEHWEHRLDEVLQDLYRTTIALGGTISGEHGIGHKRKRFMHLAMTPAELALMKRIKHAFDPNDILNPGKVFD
jgi:glycolate oxidase